MQSTTKSLQKACTGWQSPSRAQVFERKKGCGEGGVGVDGFGGSGWGTLLGFGATLPGYLFWCLVLGGHPLVKVLGFSGIKPKPGEGNRQIFLENFKSFFKTFRPFFRTFQAFF